MKKVSLVLTVWAALAAGAPISQYHCEQFANLAEQC